LRRLSWASGKRTGSGQSPKKRRSGLLQNPAFVLPFYLVLVDKVLSAGAVVCSETRHGPYFTSLQGGVLHQNIAQSAAAILTLHRRFALITVIGPLVLNLRKGPRSPRMTSIHVLCLISPTITLQYRKPEMPAETKQVQVMSEGLCHRRAVRSDDRNSSAQSEGIHCRRG